MEQYQPPESELTQTRNSSPDELPPLGRRMIRLVYSVHAWVSAARWPAGATIIPLLLWICIGSAVVATERGYSLLKFSAEAAQNFDDMADPVIFEDGRFRLEGDRPFNWTSDEVSVSIDPRPGVEASEPSSEAFIIIREDEIIIKKKRGAPEHLDVALVAELLGPERIVLNGESIIAMSERWVVWIALALAVFSICTNMVVWTIYAVIVAAILFLARGRDLKQSYASCLKITLGICVALAVAEPVLILSGAIAIMPSTILFWLSCCTGLGFWAMARVQR